MQEGSKKKRKKKQANQAQINLPISRYERKLVSGQSQKLGQENVNRVETTE